MSLAQRTASSHDQRLQSRKPSTSETRGCPTKTRFSGLFIGALAVIGLTACGGDSSSDGSPATSGSDREQVESLIRTFTDRTKAFDTDGSFRLLCTSLREKSDLKQIRQNMEGFKNVGAAAPQISNLEFASVTTNSNEGEARYSYTQVFRGETSTIQEGLKVARENGAWCIKDQLAVDTVR